MDTLGNIRHSAQAPSSILQTEEALERIRFLAETSGCGILTGLPGTGKSTLLDRAAHELRREGFAVATIEMAGMSAEELPYAFAAAFGLGVSAKTPSLAAWSRIQEHAEAGQLITRRCVLLLDHFELACPSIDVALSRLLTWYTVGCSWILTAPLSDFVNRPLISQRRSWLRIGLEGVPANDTQRVIERCQGGNEIVPVLSPEAAALLHEMTQGRIREMRHLAELASDAAFVEEDTRIEAELIRDLARELIV